MFIAVLCFLSFLFTTYILMTFWTLSHAAVRFGVYIYASVGVCRRCRRAPCCQLDGCEDYLGEID